VAIMLLLLLVFTTGSDVLLHSMLYHETRRLYTIGNNTLLTTVFTVKYIGNYGYASIYLTYNGVYAYGLIILKAPDKNPKIYIMAGDQNHWIGPITDVRVGEEIAAYILILENKTLLYNINGITGKYDLVYLPPLTTLHLVVGNVTGRASMAPKIIFDKIVIYVTNSSLSGKDIRRTLLHGSPIRSMAIGLNMSFTPTTITKLTTTTASTTIPLPIPNTSMTTTKATTPSSPQLSWTMQDSIIVAVTVIVISVIAVSLLRKKIITEKNG